MREGLDIFMGILLTIGVLLIVGTYSNGCSYKQGAIDAVSGKVEWILVEAPDKTTSWVRKENK